MARHRQEIVEEIERRRFQLNLGLLRIYNYYRVFLGVTLIAVFLQTVTETRLGRLSPELFFWTTLGYTLVNLALAVTTRALPQRLFRRQAAAVLIVLYDIVALGLLIHLSAGLTSGLGGLILVSVAAGAIVVTGRAGTFLAAIATITLLYEEFYLSLSTGASADYFQAGILGILYFAASFSIQYLSRRLRRSEISSLSHAAEAADLARVNRLIIQRMRTGLIVVDGNNFVRLVNQSARSLLGMAKLPEDTVLLPPSLLRALRAWRSDMGYRAPPFQIDTTTPEIRANFSAVRTEEPEGDVIVFLEDTTEIQQQAQQLKLAALGRLSASIAHEIRNPLGAMTHAAQLLKESQNLDRGDTRLIDIIVGHGKRMDGVIENVLELSRRKPPSPARLNLKSWLEGFVTEFADAGTRDSDIRVAVAPGNTEVRVDPGQLAQVLTNLAVNGLRYSEEHTGRKSLRLEGGVDTATDRPFLNVIDRGRGVPDDKVSHLFEPFFTTASGGTGLGLYLSRELCEANQARLSYVRHAEGGSCFRIIFAHPDRITA